MGVKIFPRSDLYRKNWDETFFDANKTDDVVIKSIKGTSGYTRQIEGNYLSGFLHTVEGIANGADDHNGL